MHILPSSPNQVDMMISSSGNFSHGSNGSISSSPDELNARLAMISFPETVPSPMPVTPEPPRMSGASKSFQSIPIIPDKSCKISCKKRKHSSCFRRVHFQQDPASRRVIRKTIYGRVNLTEEEKKALWWDKQPLRQSVRRSIRKFKSNEHCEGPSSEEFAQRYRRVLELCSSCTTVCMEEQQFNLSDAPIRGLEQKIFPETVSARQEIIRKVVAAQHKLPSHLPPEQQSKLLRAASQNLTRGSRMLARLNGMGDATAAALERI